MDTVGEYGVYVCGCALVRMYACVFVYVCVVEYKITFGPWRPFSDQNTGLTDQTCNDLAICTDQFF